MPDAIVIGAGVIGSTTALYLAREGLSVTVVESWEQSGLGTSFANGGLVTPSTALPWCSPAVPGLLLRWLGREDAPLLLRPSAIPRLGIWGAKFLANCRSSKYLASSRQMTRFARESLEETEGLLAQKSVDFSLGHGGLLELFRGEDGVKARDTYANFLEALDVRVERRDGAECVALEPHLADIAPTIRAGLLLPDDAWGDARAFTRAVETAARGLGVEFLFGTDVQGIDIEAGKIAGIRTSAGPIKTPVVVVCAGPGAKQIVKPYGIHLPIEPVKGYSISLMKSDLGFLPKRPIVDDIARLGVTPMSDHLRIAGTVEFDGYNKTVRPGRINNLIKAFKGLFPNVELPADYTPWCGHRPMSADGKPIVDATSVSGLYINTGHGALGWTLACGSAKMITNVVLRRPSTDASAFRLDRPFW
jgi:D-amino-acid dehydrogenase